MEATEDTFYYVYSCDVDAKIKIKIGTLEGVTLKPDYEKMLSNPMLKYSGLYQEACADLVVFCQIFSDSVPLSLPISSSYKSFTNRWNWNEWITIPLMFSDLPRNAVLAMTIYDCGGATELIPIGGTCISLFGKYGVFRQGIMDLKVWPNQIADPKVPSSTPGKNSSSEKEQRETLAKLSKKFHNGHMAKVDWLDRLTFSKIENIKEKEKKASTYLYLMIEFPQIIVDGNVHSVIYYEKDGDDVHQFRAHADILTMPDPEILLDNLVENKHHKLARSERSGISDKDAKPNATVRDTLNTIISYPPSHVLTSEEQDLIWKFRFYLSNQKKALTKFLQCVNWELHAEARQALDLLEEWAPMDVEDSLQLLSPAFKHPSVRRYAVTRLQQASDEDLLLYLLQLVQALKYENFDDIMHGYKKLKVPPALEASLMIEDSSSHDHNASNPESSHSDNMDLTSFLIHRACKSLTLANYFFWYLTIESEDRDYTIKQDIKNIFLQTLQHGPAESHKINSYLIKQQAFVEKLVSLVKIVARESGNRNKKIDRLQALLSDTDTFKFNFTSFEPLPLPLDPNTYIKGIIPEKATLFKSALMPSRLTFLTTTGAEYVAIFKHGDDLRQDQLILQIITLMDKILRSENLDLKLTPYRVLATNTKHGFVQFVDSFPVAEVLAKEGSIQNFFKKHHPSETGMYGISSEIMDTYVRSCAGYCVITYILGVGDRHFDNLLLTTSGKLFHIDFGYILGRDPKPLPPPMKLSKEMVEAMGGINSEHYHAFRKQCYTAFLHLRRHANLILNLFTLMEGASVPDIALEPDKAVKKVQDKFRLDLGDEEAVHYLQNLIDLSVTAVMAHLVEQLHKFAQYLKP
uniref:Phosphatidylinositol 3-kinase catalytic subunit type 3 n=1 Tax=Cacopsylla melanoneura TaxID=428564 RepID=A0A8D8XPF3_9HEMI